MNTKYLSVKDQQEALRPKTAKKHVRRKRTPSMKEVQHERLKQRLASKWLSQIKPLLADSERVFKGRHSSLRSSLCGIQKTFAQLPPGVGDETHLRSGSSGGAATDCAAGNGSISRVEYSEI